MALIHVYSMDSKTILVVKDDFYNWNTEFSL